VIVTSSRGVHHQAIAQHVLTMMLALTRAVPEHIDAQRRHEWRRRPDEIRAISGSRVGIIGYGGIGRALASLLGPFEVEIVGSRERVAAQ
jgi:phosphoglycerate dehydrogenase-like enzyme